MKCRKAGMPSEAAFVEVDIRYFRLVLENSSSQLCLSGSARVRALVQPDLPSYRSQYSKSADSPRWDKSNPITSVCACTIV